MPDQTGTVAYKCPDCGADLSFNVEGQDFACQYCGGRFTKEELESLSAKSLEQMPEFTQPEKDDSAFVKDNNLYICPTCGSEVITDSELSASAICHYCHSPVVLSGRLSGEFCPDMIIPFTVDREKALEGFDEWTKKRKFFLAKGFGSRESLEKMQGIYIPFWLADCIAEGTLIAEGIKHIATVRHGDYIVKTDSKFTVVRRGGLKIDGVPADGSSKAEDRLMESVEPFDYSRLEKFDMAYLSGHSAEKYDMTKEAVYPRIRDRVLEQTKQEFLKSAKGYDSVRVVNANLRVTGIRWTYAMLPVWFMSYSYKGKMYYYAMNGQTGKFGGTLPVNKLKMILFSFGIPFAAIMLITLLFALL